MSGQQIDDPLFDYKTYRFGRSRQIFRGPQPVLRGKYIAFLGSSYTFGRYADLPYSDLVGQTMEAATVNLGAEGAGPGFFLGDPEVRGTASNASVSVVQIMSAAAISNRMFTVRPRRNARLHEVSDLLIGIYPEVDFERFSLTKPMLRHLRELDESRFRLVMNEMKNAWIGRTQTLLSALECKTILLWFSQRAPEDQFSNPDDPTQMHYPYYVDRAMIEAVKPAADAYVECVTSQGLPQDLRVDGRTVLYRPSGVPIDENREFPSPEMHEEVSDLLIPMIRNLMED